MRMPWHNRCNEVIEVLQAEVDVLRVLNRRERERIDRLTEALARRAGIDLVIPPEEPPVVEKTVQPNPWKDPNPVTVQFGIEEKR